MAGLVVIGLLAVGDSFLGPGAGGTPAIRQLLARLAIIGLLAVGDSWLREGTLTLPYRISYIYGIAGDAHELKH